MNLVEQVQYKAALIVSGCWQGTSRMKLYDELGWESLSDRRWGRRMSLYYKIVNGLTPAYLFEHVPPEAPRPLRKFVPKAPISKTQRYDSSFFPYCINHWNTLDNDIKCSSSLANFNNVPPPLGKTLKSESSRRNANKTRSQDQQTTT